MNFVYPAFLFALFAICIPIIIHLFNFRRYKKIYFTNVKFLKDLKHESDSKSKLKELLILATRILTISSLVFAFAQPFIPVTNTHVKQDKKSVSIYLDNSFSMEAINKQGSLLDNAKKKAIDIVNAFSANDKFQLLTNDFEGKHQRLLSKEDVIEQVNTVKISSAYKSLSAVIKRQQDLLSSANTDGKYVFLLSDFQKNSMDITSTDTSIQTVLVPFESTEKSNVYIDSTWFETPVQQLGSVQKLHVRINNNSDKAIENGSLVLYINNKQVSPASFNVDAQSSSEVIINYTIKEKGVNYCKLQLQDYPITFDDAFYFTYTAETIISTLVINGKNTSTISYWQSLMKQDSLFNYHENSEAAIDYGLFSKCQFIVLNELMSFSSGLTAELSKFINQGGSVVIFPNKNGDINNYNQTLHTLQLPEFSTLDTADIKTGKINLEQGLFEGVFDKVDSQMDLPKTFNHFPIKQTTSTSGQTIIQLQNGHPFLALYKINQGKVYLFSSPLDATSSNFGKHALFVPTIIKIAITSLLPQPLFYVTASNSSITLPQVLLNKEEPIHIINTEQSFDIIPEYRMINNSTSIFTQHQINNAGHYNVMQQTHMIMPLAFNFNRQESDMVFYTSNELEQLISDKNIRNTHIISGTENTTNIGLEELNGGKKLWKLFILLALVFLALEIVIIRLVKK